MKLLIPLFLISVSPLAQASKGRVVDKAPSGFVHIQTESSDQIADHYIRADQIVLVNIVSPSKPESGEISWVNIQTNIPSSKFISANADSKTVFFTLDFATREEAVAASGQIMACLSKARAMTEMHPNNQAEQGAPSDGDKPSN
jgi:hypothetical protein